MHVADVSKGILGANGIVGAGIGLATGAALTAQLQRNGAIAVSFFGDGAVNQGVFSEALNVAALWKLPLILVCENNGFSEFSRAEDVTSGKIVDRRMLLACQPRMSTAMTYWQCGMSWPALPNEPVPGTDQLS